jgi:hypothetical protein
MMTHALQMIRLHAACCDDGTQACLRAGYVGGPFRARDVEGLLCAADAKSLLRAADARGLLRAEDAESLRAGDAEGPLPFRHLLSRGER